MGFSSFFEVVGWWSAYFLVVLFVVGDDIRFVRWRELRMRRRIIVGVGTWEIVGMG